MRTVFLGLFLSAFMFTGISTSSVDFFSATAYAQETAPVEVESAPVVTVEEKDAKVLVASDLGETKVEIPAWVGSILLFVQSAPVVGPFLAKLVPFYGIAIALLTLLATLLMGISGIIAIMSKGKATPKWVIQAKKFLDWAIHIMKFVSTYNAQKAPAPTPVQK